MRGILKAITAISVCVILGGCSLGQPGADKTSEGSGQDEMTYMSPDGYQIRYNPKEMESKETDEHTAQFIYLGEASGDNIATVTYIADKQPEEVLYEITESWGDQEAIDRSEGFFPGTDDKWGYWRTLSPADGGKGIARTAIAGEYNGGVLLFELEEQMTGDDEKDMAVSDTLAMIPDSITYDKFEPQTLYSYYPGTYTTENGRLILNEDHTGTLSFQDDIGILWGTYEIMGTDGSFTYDFTIEGDYLYLDYDGRMVEFEKQK